MCWQCVCWECAWLIVWEGASKETCDLDSVCYQHNKIAPLPMFSPLIKCKHAPSHTCTQVTQVLEMPDFYNDAVNEPDFNFKEDYKCWTSVS